MFNFFKIGGFAILMAFVDVTTVITEAWIKFTWPKNLRPIQETVDQTGQQIAKASPDWLAVWMSDVNWMQVCIHFIIVIILIAIWRCARWCGRRLRRQPQQEEVLSAEALRPGRYKRAMPSCIGLLYCLAS